MCAAVNSLTSSDRITEMISYCYAKNQLPQSFALPLQWNYNPVSYNLSDTQDTELNREWKKSGGEYALSASSPS